MDANFEYSDPRDKVMSLFLEDRDTGFTMQPDLYLGDYHWLSWLCAGRDAPYNTEWVGALVAHIKSDLTPCEGSVNWTETLWEREHPERKYNHVLWTLTGEPGEHMTLSPSLLCSCGDHGFIQDGKWIRA